MQMTPIVTIILDLLREIENDFLAFKVLDHSLQGVKKIYILNELNGNQV